MKTSFFVWPIAVFMFFGTPQAGSPTGFYVWSKGDHSTRELKWQKLEAGIGPVGEVKTLVQRGDFSDIEVTISLDGRWIAFARELESIHSCCWDRPGDYHMFGNYDIYIARIDGALPAVPQKVGHGYWPSWGDDSDGPVKTLYYSWAPGTGREGGQLKIMKATIGPDGVISEPEEHILLPKGSHDPHMQCAPNGRYVAVRYNGMYIYDSQTGELSSSMGGCSPSWGSDSYWIYWAPGPIAAHVDGELKGKIYVPYQYYHCGWSNDMKWIIGRKFKGSKDKNTAHPLELRSAEFSKPGEPVVEASTQHELDLPEGTWCDIHVNSVVSTDQRPFGTPLFNARVQNNGAGLVLIINSLTPEKVNGGLYGMNGQRKVFFDITGFSGNAIPLYGIAEGAYILRLYAGSVRSQQKVNLTR